MKRHTYNIMYYLNSSKRRKDGSCPVMGRITIDGEAKTYSLGMSLLPEIWDAAKGMATGKGKESVMVNRKIEADRAAIKSIYEQMLDSGYVTAQRIKNQLVSTAKPADTLLNLFRTHNEAFAKRVGVDRVDVSYRRYRQTFDVLAKYINIHLLTDDIALEQVDEAFVQGFDSFMRNDCRLKDSSIQTYMTGFKTVISKALAQGLIDRQPFGEFKIKQIRGNYRHLGADEFDRVLSTPITAPHLSFVRDMFVFSCFTGLAYIDLKNLTEQQLVTETDGSMWIRTHRQKTGSDSVIKLLNIPCLIIDKYKSVRKGERIFNVQHYSKFYLNVHNVGLLCGIERLQFHAARHTFATLICMSNGVPVETISRMMGHSSIATTQIYAEITHQKVDEDMKKLKARMGESK